MFVIEKETKRVMMTSNRCVNLRTFWTNSHFVINTFMCPIEPFIYLVWVSTKVITLKIKNLCLYFRFLDSATFSMTLNSKWPYFSCTFFVPSVSWWNIISSTICDTSKKDCLPNYIKMKNSGIKIVLSLFTRRWGI